MEPAKTKSAKWLLRPLLFVGMGCAIGLLYAIAFYGLLKPVLFLGAGTGIFLALSYYVIEFLLLKKENEAGVKHFIKAVLYYTPVLSVAIFVLLLMNDIAMALQDYGDLEDIPVSLSILPLVVLFSFFAAFVFVAVRDWGKK